MLLLPWTDILIKEQQTAIVAEEENTRKLVFGPSNAKWLRREGVAFWLERVVVTNSPKEEMRNAYPHQELIRAP